MRKEAVLKISRPLRLSRNRENHTRKHCFEFGFEQPEQFTKDEMLTIARRVVETPTRIFRDTDGLESVLIFLQGGVVVIISETQKWIKALFAIRDIEFVNRRLERKKWIEIEMEK
jgi:hypothetical protein